MNILNPKKFNIQDFQFTIIIVDALIDYIQNGKVNQSHDGYSSWKRDFIENLNITNELKRKLLLEK